MNLKEYIDINDISTLEFANLIGLDRAHTNMLILGHRVPSRRTALRIERITKGKIKAKDLLFPKDKEVINES